jgi:type I site-specific restriction-modification system R (restriction) subunit
MRTYRDKKFIGSVFVQSSYAMGYESFQNISKYQQAIKEREKESFNNEKDRLDIVIVVNMIRVLMPRK